MSSPSRPIAAPVTVLAVATTLLVGAPAVAEDLPPSVQSFAVSPVVDERVTFTARTAQPVERTITISGGGQTFTNRNTTDEAGSGWGDFLGRTTHTAPVSGLDAAVTYRYVAEFVNRSGGTAVVDGTIRASPQPEPEVGTGFSYEEPDLVDPVTYVATSSDPVVRIPAGQDAVVRTDGALVDARGGLQVFGGRNVVIDAEVTFTRDLNPGQGSGMDNRGMYIRGGGHGDREIFVRRFVLSGRHVKEGIQISTDEEDVTVTIDHYDASTASFRRSGNHHPDIVQAWSGPKTLRINRLYAPQTDYQGVFLQQHQYGSESGYEVWLDNVYIGGSEVAGYLLWNNDSSRVHVGENAPGSVYVSHDRFGRDDHRIFWDARHGGPGRGEAWKDVRYGERARGEVLG